jgi:hypothetical protein
MRKISLFSKFRPFAATTNGISRKIKRQARGSTQGDSKEAMMTLMLDTVIQNERTRVGFVIPRALYIWEATSILRVYAP